VAPAATVANERHPDYHHNYRSWRFYKMVTDI